MNSLTPCRITDERLPEWKPTREDIMNTLEFDQVLSHIQFKWKGDLGNLRISAIETICGLQRNCDHKASQFKAAQGDLRLKLMDEHDEAEKTLKKATGSLSEAMESTPSEDDEIECLARFIWEHDQEFFEDEIEEYVLSVSKP